jgi:hypothetical protein
MLSRARRVVTVKTLYGRSALICRQKPARHRVTRFHLTVFTTQETDVGSIP